ncbi:phenoloxidase-activating factor 1-like [Cylas formicarius]|uniref:phenoloxidase-activating factor 1-like n=1 Tax=Cylas formicarius TaxID=197179 RepID=UPI002958A2AD|nr:phenoloxidase-activating factor 1-like [Cylas formicarius]XP_060532657.1 phenoloxidase-activating factor 1-like [Cylas formicarius]XP_060532658.1 phenoloxidase-activating factor 1-like [Cylas formicarius]XP_060532659.1 phenoloxidase-activating factor 1-like [Cylas formicarius]
MKLFLLIVAFWMENFACQELVSPCPRIFQYERKAGENDRWYGTATLTSTYELLGVWFKVFLDKPSIQLGNWFGEVRAADNNTEYLIHNKNYKVAPNTNFTVKFYIVYDPNEPPPKLLTFRLNARELCPERPATTPGPVITGQLFTNPTTSNAIPPPPTTAKPLSINPAAPNQNTGVVFQRPVFRPEVGGNADEEYFQSDFSQSAQIEQNVLGDACGTVIKQPRPLITHGQETVGGEFPWHAALYHTRGIDLTYICGGSLITTQHVITVAHCVTRRKTNEPLSPNNLVVYLGKYYLTVWKQNPGIQNRQVSKVIVYPKYFPQNFTHDIAILKLETACDITNWVRPVCLWEGASDLQNVVSKLGTVVGWGYDEKGKVSEELTKAHMPIVSQLTCVYSLPDFYSRFTSVYTFCAGFKNGTSVCNGDSGGGLVLPKPESDPKNPVWQIRGLISISVALQNRFRCDSSHYVVFTDVARYMDWVHKALLV